MLRRNPGADWTKVFLCHAPRRVQTAQPARLTGTYRAGPVSGKAGLDDHEGRNWQGWHRHTTLCMLLHFFLLQSKLASHQDGPVCPLCQVDAMPYRPCFAVRGGRGSRR